jgi:hypothetical protein
MSYIFIFKNMREARLPVGRFPVFRQAGPHILFMCGCTAFDGMGFS